MKETKKEKLVRRLNLLHKSIPFIFLFVMMAFVVLSIFELRKIALKLNSADWLVVLLFVLFLIVIPFIILMSLDDKKNE